jgi:hypothetical protein
MFITGSRMPMTTRTRGETVTFLHSFEVRGEDGRQPAGSYLVETDEELLHGLSFPAYRRLATVIHLAGRLGSNELSRVVEIDPAELAAAQANDIEAPEAAPTPATRSDARPQERRSGAGQVATSGWEQWLALNRTELTWTALLAGGMALAGLLSENLDSALGPP